MSKDSIIKRQLAADAWYVANPDLTMVEFPASARVGKSPGRVPGQDQLTLDARRPLRSPRPGARAGAASTQNTA